MKSFAIKDKDLVFDGQGDLVMIDGKEEEQQAIERLLTTNTGEWFLNVLHGLAYKAVLVKPFDEERARLAIVEAISQEPRAKEVDDIRFNFDRVKRHMDITVKVKMRSGNEVEVVIPLE